MPGRTLLIGFCLMPSKNTSTKHSTYGSLHHRPSVHPSIQQSFVSVKGNGHRGTPVLKRLQDRRTLRLHVHRQFGQQLQYSNTSADQMITQWHWVQRCASHLLPSSILCSAYDAPSGSAAQKHAALGHPVPFKVQPGGERSTSLCQYCCGGRSCHRL